MFISLCTWVVFICQSDESWSRCFCWKSSKGLVLVHWQWHFRYRPVNCVPTIVSLSEDFKLLCLFSPIFEMQESSMVHCSLQTHFHVSATWQVGRCCEVLFFFVWNDILYTDHKLDFSKCNILLKVLLQGIY